MLRLFLLPFIRLKKRLVLLSLISPELGVSRLHGGACS
jgi:hypothetical protein